jgi:hypothetical protein
MKFLQLLSPYESIPILSFALVVLVLIVLQSYKAIKGKKISGILNDCILFLGFLSLSWGILWQIYGLIHVAQVVMIAGEISPSLLWAGLRISLVPILMGLAILIVSAVAWFVLRASRSANYARDAR